MKKSNCCTDDYGLFLNLALLVLRLAVASLMLTHGIPKLMNLIEGNLSFPDPIGLGSELSLVLVVFAEVICSLLVLVGYKSRLAVMPLIVVMLVALLVQHSNDPILDHWNILAYIFCYAILLHLGGGRYSLTYFFAELK